MNFHIMWAKMSEHNKKPCMCVRSHSHNSIPRLYISSILGRSWIWKSGHATLTNTLCLTVLTKPDQALWRPLDKIFCEALFFSGGRGMETRSEKYNRLQVKDGNYTKHYTKALQTVTQSQHLSFKNDHKVHKKNSIRQCPNNPFIQCIRECHLNAQIAAI